MVPWDLVSRVRIHQREVKNASILGIVKDEAANRAVPYSGKTGGQIPDIDATKLKKPSEATKTTIRTANPEA